MYAWNLKKGIGLLATGDWTHPLWVRELKANLEETGTGLLRLKPEIREQLSSVNDASEGIPQDDKSFLDPVFLLSGEVSCIYSHHGKLRRNHILLFVPSFDVVDKINAELVKQGCNLTADGRPVLGLSSQEVCEVVWSVSEEVAVIPAHAWTPWFSVFGSRSGYDSLEECFGQFASRIYAIETGLSSDPAMNWRIGELDTRSLVSFSDAHSGPKLMREATIFAKPTTSPWSFNDVSTALKNYRSETSRPYIAATIEFYPEEGKYHYDGHRACGVMRAPAVTKTAGTTCPVCGRSLTIGVLHRVEDLATRTVAELKLERKPLYNWPVAATFSNAFPQRPPYIMLVPLLEIIAQCLGVSSASKRVLLLYNQLVAAYGGEFNVLCQQATATIAKEGYANIAWAIDQVRQGTITIKPGYDGVYGTIALPSGTASDVGEQLSLV
jgi:uncharacterized protein (TIGR00375 family)